MMVSEGAQQACLAPTASACLYPSYLAVVVDDLLGDAEVDEEQLPLLAVLAHEVAATPMHPTPPPTGQPPTPPPPTPPCRPDYSLGLDVPVYDAEAVQLLEQRHHLLGQVHAHGQRQAGGRLAVPDLRHVLAPQQLHHDVLHPHSAHRAAASAPSTMRPP